AVLPEDAEPVELPVSAGAGVSDAGAIVRLTRGGGLYFYCFVVKGASLGPPPAPAPPGPPAAPAPGLRLALGAFRGVGAGHRQIARQYLTSSYPRCSLWWTAGSSDVSPTLLVCSGLPTPDAFGAFLDGRWEQWGWSGTAGDTRVLLDAET